MIQQQAMNRWNYTQFLQCRIWFNFMKCRWPIYNIVMTWFSNDAYPLTGNDKECTTNKNASTRLLPFVAEVLLWLFKLAQLISTRWHQCFKSKIINKNNDLINVFNTVLLKIKYHTIFEIFTDILTILP